MGSRCATFRKVKGDTGFQSPWMVTLGQEKPRSLTPVCWMNANISHRNHDAKRVGKHNSSIGAPKRIAMGTVKREQGYDLANLHWNASAIIEIQTIISPNLNGNANLFLILVIKKASQMMAVLLGFLCRRRHHFSLVFSQWASVHKSPKALPPRGAYISY